MAVNVEALGIDQLSVGDRLELIEFIWDSLPDDLIPADVPPWHLAELAKRRAESNLNPGVGKPWREVLSQLSSKS